MKLRSLTQVMGAVALVAALALGPTATPAGANPSDVYLLNNTVSPQYSLGGCLYKVMWGNYGGAPFTQVLFYNLTACGGAIVAVEYTTGSAVLTAFSTTVTKIGSDGCGPYQVIQATGGTGFALRGLVWVGTGAQWYASDGLAAQPIHALC